MRRACVSLSVVMFRVAPSIVQGSGYRVRSKYRMASILGDSAEFSSASDFSSSLITYIADLFLRMGSHLTTLIILLTKELYISLTECPITFWQARRSR